MVISWVVEFRDERKHRAEFDLLNHCEVPVSVTYRGFYQSAEQELAPEGKWHRKFRAGDRLFLSGKFEGYEITNQVHLWESVSDLFSPGRPAQGEILLWRVSTNAEGKMTMYTPVSSNSMAAPGEKNVPEFYVNWRLMPP
jgi:hypothetical protein